jgi:hypothetical protein
LSMWRSVCDYPCGRQWRVFRILWTVHCHVYTSEVPACDICHFFLTTNYWTEPVDKTPERQMALTRCGYLGYDVLCVHRQSACRRTKVFRASLTN